MYVRPVLAMIIRVDVSRWSLQVCEEMVKDGNVMVDDGSKMSYRWSFVEVLHVAIKVMMVGLRFANQKEIGELEG
ncbi:hypothetical protein LR48_Vigan1242s000200 [Vigna angularis]|uniref:Uncharacterized protein n=1 Tax=Phaseolus angularis TaxID=3914 RepID=A0A0L9TIS5_PHAAN|nr:hypothetical protein LR48_Vigan1242s000200 [Vigna angularis]